MNNSSAAYVSAQGITYRFTGVISTEINTSLKLSTEANQNGSIQSVTGAAVNPSKVVMKIVESDVMHMPGWSARMLQALDAIRYNRCLCILATNLMVFYNMLLSGIDVVWDETNNNGFSGTLTFTESSEEVVEEQETEDTNASVQTNTGSAGTGQTVTGTPLTQMLSQAGIQIITIGV